MSFDSVIGKLGGIVENPEGKVALYFTRKDYKGRYTSYKPGISTPLQKELTKIVVEAMKGLNNKTVLPFNPSGSLDDTIEYCDYSSVDSLWHILESLDGDRLLESIPDDISKFSFYCLVIQLEDDDKLLIFRRLTKFKKLQKGIVGRFISGDFEQIDSDLLGIDGQIDIIGYDSELTVANHISMERIFDIKTQYQESAKKTLAMIKETNRIENFEQFEEDSINDGRVIRGLTKLLQDPERVKRSLENIEKVKELVDVVDLDIKFSEDDSKLLYERKDQLQNITLIIRDAYYQSFINERLGVDELA
ncbi:Kiwa anti-phage protein KwaB-like domain-containing protein [Gracilibacillus sp. YIM 98692]|uniref:Kiwa anti-phage protein KwaB-like domain-containing protein n=1 Tax=Gracilibacillus sp. YIM 98692 TaxID=2663532 RepID=UPI0013D781ED|nr:Kiwa anti-phage protein KwaB-like domain-containing protein [Gracilibacillus sp. YIM 98692]